MNYYKILELDPVTASHEEITGSFRRLALKYHPMKSTENLSSNQKEFSKVCEAYDVLSNNNLKSIYDKYGESGLKNGIPKKKEYGKAIGGYTFEGNCFQIFEQFFGHQNPFTDNFVAGTSSW